LSENLGRSRYQIWRLLKRFNLAWQCGRQPFMVSL
jgi:hypothetical protein